MKPGDDPKGFIAFNNRPNFFWVGIAREQFFVSVSFKPRTVISGGLVEVVFQQFIAMFKFIKVLHAQILLHSFENVPGEITTQRANSQGLQFEVKEADKWLREFYAREPVQEVCIWRLDRLHERLAEKHRETFWVKAKSIQRSGSEWFQLESVTHTTRPSLNQFDRLLTDGTVTMDHLIKRKASGRVTEKGPLFKIHRPRIGELFLGEPRSYSLES